MIHTLKLENVGPAPEVELEFSHRLNIFTGDNGLGKSFFLDVIWWSMTRKWLKQINPKLASGDMALPHSSGDATIKFSMDGKSKRISHYESRYIRKNYSWQGNSGRPMNPGLIIYAMADGGMAIWDPMRNYWKTVNKIDEQVTPPAYVFSAQELWNGLPSLDGNGSYCRGLIDDWLLWQQLNTPEWKMLNEVLRELSPNENEVLQSGNPVQLDVTKVNEMPTLKMHYGCDVPIIHTSSGIRRVLSLAYAIVWAWQSHVKAAKSLDEPVTKQVTLLIDEIESHLHPQWQKRFLGALMKVMKNIQEKTSFQIFLTTHSPLVMVSCEDFFNHDKDTWVDLDYHNGTIQITKRPFMKQGDADAWLKSEAFDLKSTHSLANEKLIKQADALRKQNTPPASIEELHAMSAKLAKNLGETSDFYFMWDFYVTQREKDSQ